MSTFIEYTVYQNATFKNQLSLKDDTGSGMNLVPYTVTGQVKKSYGTSNVAANLVITMIDAANGVVQLSLPWEVTANIKAGTYVYDVKALNSSTDEAVRLIQGLMIFAPAVTKP